jgi:hypothetical protein
VRASLPPSFVPSGLAEIVVLSDLWSPMSEIRTMLAGLSASGAHGSMIQVVDPAEETFPYSGRVEFVEPEGFGVVTAGRAESWASDYVARVALHLFPSRAPSIGGQIVRFELNPSSQGAHGVADVIMTSCPRHNSFS